MALDETQVDSFQVYMWKERVGENKKGEKTDILG